MLFHFSEEPEIGRFVPRPSRLADRGPVVWAIDEWHSPAYYLPRHCPRVCFWPGEGTSKADRERYFGYVPARMVVAIEAGWLKKVMEATLYRYAMPREHFEDLCDNGMFVSTRTVEPLEVAELTDLPDHLVRAGVELRVCQSLVPLSQVIAASTMDYSMIRMRNIQENLAITP